MRRVERGHFLVARNTGRGEALIEIGGDAEVVAHPRAKQRFGKTHRCEGGAKLVRISISRCRHPDAGFDVAIGRLRRRESLYLAENEGALDEALCCRGHWIGGGRRFDEAKRDGRACIGERDRLTTNNPQRAFDQLALLRRARRARAEHDADGPRSPVDGQNACPREIWNTELRSRAPLRRSCGSKLKPRSARKGPSGER